MILLMILSQSRGGHLGESAIYDTPCLKQDEAEICL